MLNSNGKRTTSIGHLEISVIRRSRESGNPEKSRRWIPAYAGMTSFSSFSIEKKKPITDFESSTSYARCRHA
jgi:hypothetical protein